MPTIPTLYTGQQSGAAPIYTGSKTEAALSQGVDRLITAKKEDVGVARQEAKDFREMMDVDPIQAASDKSMAEHCDPW